MSEHECEMYASHAALDWADLTICVRMVCSDENCDEDVWRILDAHELNH